MGGCHMTGLTRLFLFCGIVLLAALYRPKTLADASLGLVETAGLPGNEESEERQAVQPSIVGGQETDIQSFPWVVSIVSSQAPDAYAGHRCGGTLAASDRVLTSAHCVFNGDAVVSPEELWVLAGQADLSGNSGQTVRVTEILPHPEFDAQTGDHDVALIRLSRGLEYAPVHIPFLDPHPLVEAGAEVTVVGWGSMASSEDLAAYPYILRKAKLQLTDAGQCQESLRLHTGQAYAITARMLCASSLTSAADACTGDSGGPLLYWHPDLGTWIQIGVISWGIGCAVPELPGVYANLHPLASWIRDAMASSPDWNPDPETLPTPARQDNADSDPDHLDAGLTMSYYFPFVPRMTTIP